MLQCDQGYGSERSPEEEYPPSLPGHDGLCLHHMDSHSCYPFITPGESINIHSTLKMQLLNQKKKKLPRLKIN